MELLPQAPPELLAAIQGVETPAALADMVATYMDATTEEKQEILETIDIERAHGQGLAPARPPHRGAAAVRGDRPQTKAALDERQREVLLREQMAAIQRQLGEGDEGKAAEMAELERSHRQGQHAEGGRGPGAQGTAPAASACRKPPPNTAWCAPISTG